MPAFLALVLREQIRFWQDPLRIGGRMIQPLAYLFMLGAGMSPTSTLGRGAYSGFIFPGVVAMSLLFTAAYSAAHIVFDREIGFFKAVLVAPVPRRTIAAGKVASGALLARPGALYSEENQKLTVKFENDRVRVLELRLKPGEGEGFHAHPQYLLYALTNYRVKNTAADGTSKVFELSPLGTQQAREFRAKLLE